MNEMSQIFDAVKIHMSNGNYGRIFDEKKNRMIFWVMIPPDDEGTRPSLQKESKARRKLFIDQDGFVFISESNYNGSFYEKTIGAFSPSHMEELAKIIEVTDSVGNKAFAKKIADSMWSELTPIDVAQSRIENERNE